MKSWNLTILFCKNVFSSNFLWIHTAEGSSEYSRWYKRIAVTVCLRLPCFIFFLIPLSRPCQLDAIVSHFFYDKISFFKQTIHSYVVFDRNLLLPRSSELFLPCQFLNNVYWYPTPELTNRNCNHIKCCRLECVEKKKHFCWS